MMLHNGKSYSVVTIWDCYFNLIKEIRLEPCSHIVVEKGSRYFASLMSNGGVEVWSMKTYSKFWSLEFKSVK